VAFEESELLHTNILAIGSDHITNDIAIGLRTSVDVAETVKLEYGRAINSAAKKDEVINLSKIDKSEEGQISRNHLTDIISARLEEIFSMVNKELKTVGRDGQLPAGALLTGGGAKIPGIVELAKKELRLPVQIGYPLNISTIIDRVDDPAYATAVGLVLWANEYLESSKGGMGRFASGILHNASIDKIRKFFKQFLP